MNFDRLAGHYAWMETVLAGPLMQRCRTAFLPRVQECRRALLVGEGTGKFLTALLRGNPRVQVTCVEFCAGMIEQARRRVRAAGLDLSRVQFLQMDALDWNPPVEKFDLVATHFFLDCFPAAQLEKLVPLLDKSATTDAIWLLADFRMPARGWQRWRATLMLTMLYTFFRFTTALAARRLTPPDRFLRRAGFTLVERRLASFGFTHSDLWQRTHA